MLNKDSSLSQVLSSVEQKIMNKMNVMKIGKVITFYSDDKTADVEITYKKNVDGKLISYPLLLKCPVVCNHITYPVKSGEYCMVIFSDVNIDRWFEEGQGEPYTQEKHSISDGIAIVGLNNLINKITDYETDRIDLREDSVVSANLEVEKDTLLDGKLEVKKSTKLDDTLEVDKSTSLHDTLDVDKDSSFKMNVNILLNLTVTGNITCNNLTATTISCGGMSVSSSGVTMTKPLSSTEKIETSSSVEATSYKVNGVEGYSGTKVITNPETGTTIATITVDKGIITNIS